MATSYFVVFEHKKTCILVLWMFAIELWKKTECNCSCCDQFSFKKSWNDGNMRRHLSVNTYGATMELCKWSQTRCTCCCVFSTVFTSLICPPDIQSLHVLVNTLQSRPEVQQQTVNSEEQLPCLLMKKWNKTQPLSPVSVRDTFHNTTVGLTVNAAWDKSCCCCCTDLTSVQKELFKPQKTEKVWCFCFF